MMKNGNDGFTGSKILFYLSSLENKSTIIASQLKMTSSRLYKPKPSRACPTLEESEMFRFEAINMINNMFEK